MNELPMEIEILEILRTTKDVEFAFKRRGYSFHVFEDKKKYFIQASLKNHLDETINYEFEGKTIEKCYIKAAFFLRAVQNIREELEMEFC